MQTNMKKVSTFMVLAVATITCFCVLASELSAPKESDLVISQRDKITWNRFYAEFRKVGPHALTQEEKKMLVHVLEKARKLSEGLLLVDAIAVDEKGNPIPKAPYELMWTRAAPEIHHDAAKDEFQQGVASDQGRVRLVLNHSNIKFSFKMKGYYPNSSIYHSIHLFRQSNDELVNYFSGDKKDVREFKARCLNEITLRELDQLVNTSILPLEKQGPLTKLDPRFGVLPFDQAKPKTIFHYKPLPQADTGDRSYDHCYPATDRIGTNEHDVHSSGFDIPKAQDAAVPETSGFVLIPQTDDKGHVAQVEVPAITGFTLLPRKVTLRAIGKDEGFVPVGFLPAPYLPYRERPHTERQMKRAPDNGYSKDLVLDAGLIQKQMESRSKWNGCPEPYWFYFKINGKYGRGQLWFMPKRSSDGANLEEFRDQLARLQSLGARARVHIQPGIADLSPDAVCFYARFDVQPDGSTNLETGE